MDLSQLKDELDRALADLKAGIAEVQPYNHRPLTAAENQLREGIIKGQIIPARNRFNDAEIEINSKQFFEGAMR